jgi:hypothetical protein
VIVANLHPGCAVMAWFLASCLLMTSEGSTARYGWLVVFSLTFLLTPYHVEAVPFVLDHFFYHRTAIAPNPDHRSLSIGMFLSPSHGFAPLFWAALTGAGLLGLSRRSPRDTDTIRRLSLLVPALVFTLLSINRIRAFPFAVVFFLPHAGPVVSDFLLRFTVRRATLFALLVVSFSIGAVAGGHIVHVGIGLGAGRIFPVAAVDFIKRHRPQGNVFHAVPDGAYLVWHLRDYPVFSDPRETPFRTAHSELQAIRSEGEARELFRKYDVNVILDRAYLPRTGYRREDWALVYFDDKSAVHLRRIRPHARLISAYEYRRLRPERQKTFLSDLLSGDDEYRREFIRDADLCKTREPSGRICARAGQAVQQYRATSSSSVEPSAEGAGPFSRTSNIPLLSIKTAGIPHEPGGKAAATLELFAPGACRLDAFESCRSARTMAAHIGVRGQSSRREFPKKSYVLDLRDGRGRHAREPLLGMPSGAEWVLSACYADRTCLRNKLSYEVAAGMGRWAPRSEFVELFIDGRFHGLYLLVERINRGRLGLRALRRRGGGAVSGGFVIRREGEGKGPLRDFSSSGGGIWTFHDPSWKGIGLEQRQYIRRTVDRFEAAMTGPNWKDQRRGYPSVIDIPSWVDFAIVQELTHNVDGYWKSMYLHTRGEPNPQLFAGPVWDLDLGFGNTGLRGGAAADAWAFQGNDRAGGQLVVPLYWQRLWSDPRFWEEVSARWQQLRISLLSGTRLEKRIDDLAAVIEQAQVRNELVWNTSSLRSPLTGSFGPTFSDQVTGLKAWLESRLTWMDAAFDSGKK